MRRNARKTSELVLFAALSFGTVPLCLVQINAQSSAPATQALLDKAHTLEAKGRLDMAAQTWQQVLLADPNNTEALGGLARSARSSGNQALSNTYLQRLRSINPADPGIARAEGMMTQANQVAQLQHAGKLASAGSYAQAMTIYRQVFGAQPPAGDWSLAYYQTEAATDDGKSHAIAGLRGLVDSYPQDSRYQIALGRILTYNPKTRSEGRRLLQRYPKDTQATEALKQSLVWDAQNPATSGEIRSYLQMHKDAQLEESLRNTDAQTHANARSPRRTSTKNSGAGNSVSAENNVEIAQQRTLGTEENAAYVALNAKRFDEADMRFKALLAKYPHDARALAGIGYVRMNQQNFSGAISFLEQAKEDGAKDPVLDRNLATARFYFVLSEGGIALTENDLPMAEQKYQQALQMRPNSPEALQGLGGTLLKAGQPQAAVPYYQQFVRAKPLTAAWRGLFTAQYQAGNAVGALETERQIPVPIRSELMRDPDYLRTLASAYSAVGRDADAQRVLRAALDLPFPQGALGLKADTQLQYASLLLQANRLDQASGLYRQVLSEDPENVIAWQGLVSAQHATHGDSAALQTLESMPSSVYDQALRDPGFLGTAAAIYQANNKYDLAQSLLERAIAARNTSGQKVPLSLQIQLAGLYLQRNDAAHAFPIFQRVLSENPERIDAWKGLLTSLHGSGRDQELLAQIQQIPTAIQKQLENDVDYLQTVGQMYNSLGQPRQATAFLSRVQQHYAAQHIAPPADVDVQNAWLLYNGQNDTGLYRQLLFLGGRHDLNDDQRRTVQTIWANWAVRRANQASAAGNVRRALAILNAAAKSFPDNSAVAKGLAGGYQRAGLPKEAVTLFKAQDMSSASAADYKAAVGAALAANDLKDGEIWLRFGLHQFPKDSEMLTLAARFEQARGDSGRAADYYKASLAAMPPADPGSELAYMLNQPVPLNPRALPTAQRPQDLASLLAPGSDSAAGQPAIPSPPRPYLPSYGNAYGAAPVQIGSNSGSASNNDVGVSQNSGSVRSQYESSGVPRNDGRLVPNYMSNQGTAGRDSRLAGSDLGIASDDSEIADQNRRSGSDGSAVVSNSSGSSGAGSASGGSGVASGGRKNRSSSSRLGDYRPPTETNGTDSIHYTAPDEMYLPPAAGLGPDGMSETNLPGSAQPGQEVQRYQAAQPESYLAFQKEQIRRAGEEAVVANVSPLFGTQPISNVAYKEGAQTGSYNGEVFGPYIPYVAPSTDGKPAIRYSAKDVEVPVQTTIMAEFPAGVGKSVPLRNAKSRAHASPHHAQDAAAEAAEIRRRQSDLPSTLEGASGYRAPGEASDLSTGQNAQYTTGSARSYKESPGSGAGQTTRSSSIPATAPTNTVAGTDPFGMNRNSTATVPTNSSSSLGQQYPQPIRRSSGVASAGRRTRPRTARAVAGFGVNGPPVFYPSVPTALSSQPYPDLPPYNTNGQQPPTDPQLVARNVPPLRGRYGPIANSEAGAGPPLSERQQTELDLASLEASYSGWVGGSGSFRTRSGEPGIDRLFDLEVPFEASAVMGKAARFTVVPRAVFLNSGTIDSTRYTGTNVPYLGTLPANAINTPSPQYASGVGGEIQMVTQNVGIAVGYTPYEFLVNNITARFRYRPFSGPLTLFGEREAVKDTQLSYAGLRDPGSVALSYSGNIWGGVISTGGGIRLDHGNERSGLYASADGAVLTGYHVLQNQRIEGTMGAYFRVKQFPRYGSLNVGASLYAEHYDHNERALTYGNGGYFSPEAYFLGSIPITFNGYYKTTWHYVVQAAVGVQTFQEDTAQFFPLDPGVQTQAYSGCTLVQIANHTCPTAELPVNNSTGANFNVNAEATYRIADHWYMGAAFVANNTNNYNQVQPTVFLRYLFRPQVPTEEYPTGLFPTDGFRPLRVP